MIKRAFQAVRIATNAEMLNLQNFMESAPRDVLAPGALLMILTFHSLEERVVSQFYNKWRRGKLGEFGTKKPLEPSPEEVAENTRSRSAKLHSFVMD